jgi:hypothetical protein
MKNEGLTPGVVLQFWQQRQMDQRRDGRLWLCDKWIGQLQIEKVQQKQVLQEVVKNMIVFLNYREKYYGTKSEDDKNLLSAYLAQDNKAGILSKLQAYKEWWTTNKSGSLLGLLINCPQRLYGNVSRVFAKLYLFLASMFGK